MLKVSLGSTSYNSTLLALYIEPLLIGYTCYNLLILNHSATRPGNEFISISGTKIVDLLDFIRCAVVAVHFFAVHFSLGQKGIEGESNWVLLSVKGGISCGETTTAALMLRRNRSTPF